MKREIYSQSKLKEFIILTGIIIVDLVTKLTAYFFLPFEEKLCLIEEKLCFYLVYNFGSSNAITDDESISYTLFICFIFFVLLFYILFIRKQRIHTFFKILIGAGLFVALAAATELIQPLFEGIHISARTIGVIKSLTVLIFVGSIFFLCVNKWIRLSLMVYCAGGIGNLLSYFYPPFGSIDFIYLKISYSRFVSFNMADIATYVGIIGGITVLLFFVIKQLKKVIKKSSVFKRIVIFCVLLFCILFVIYYKSEKTYSVNLMERSDESGHLYIPVTINDSVYPFAFDTGASHNVIDSTLAQKIGLNADRVRFMTISRFTEAVRSDSIAFTYNQFSIGNLKTSGIFALNGYKGLFIDDVELMQSVGAIIGRETIRHYNWLFNFADNTVSISKGKIRIPALSDDQILTFTFDYNENMKVSMEVDGITIQNVTFDTGFGHTSVEAFEKTITLDIIFSKSDFEAYKNKLQSSVSIYSKGREFVMIDSMQINDFKIHGIVAYEDKEFARTLITANFIRSFRMMYIDSKNKKIQLYISSSDSARYQRKHIQDYIRNR